MSAFKNSSRIAVVIPAYNEAATIRTVVIQTLMHLNNVIVVDDGSRDATTGSLRDLPITILQNASNLGKAASLERGLRYAMQHGAEAILTLDADLQHDPHDIPRLLAAFEQHPKKIIIASRVRGEKPTPFLRLFANKFANFWISWSAGYRIQDSQSGFRLYPTDLLEELKIPCGRTHSFVYESELLIMAAWRGYQSVAVEVLRHYPEERRASYYRTFADTWQITRMVARKLLQRHLYLSGLYRSLFG